MNAVAPPPAGVIFRAIDEAGPGSKLRSVYERRADVYRDWYLREGDAARPSLQEGLLALQTHMPELVPVHAEVSEIVADGDPVASRMFTFLRPPASFVSCSQGVWAEGDDGPVLVRNYDYPPELMDCVILRSRFLDRTVVGTADGVWGLCDGMNDRGLAVSLTFGGRLAVGDGFGMPLVIRYLLETCDTAQEGRVVLERLPFAQPYNLTLADVSGDVVTAYLGPDRPPSFRRLPVATNHQWVVETFDPALADSSVTREWWLLRLLDDPEVDSTIFSDWFLQAPLYSFGHAEGVGTVYTAEYSPREGSVRHRWHDQEWMRTLDRFEEGERTVTFPVLGLPSIA